MNNKKELEKCLKMIFQSMQLTLDNKEWKRLYEQYLNIKRELEQIEEEL